MHHQEVRKAGGSLKNIGIKLHEYRWKDLTLSTETRTAHRIYPGK